MSVPAELSDILAGPLEGVTRIVVRHERRQRFRWLSLVELGLWILFLAVVLVCLAVVLVLAVVLGEGGGGGGGGEEGGVALPFHVRFFHRWQELAIRLQDAEGNALSELRHTPRTETEGQAVLAAILAAAAKGGVVVVETLGGAAAETLEVWYGGQPLLAHPELRDPEASAATLERSSYELSRDAEGLTITHRHEPRSRVGAFFRLLVELVLLPLMFWSRGFRRGLTDTLLDLRGVPPEAWVLVVHSSKRLSTRRERGGRVEAGVDLDARDILGLTYSACLAYDKDVTRRPPTLRIVTRDGVHPLPPTDTHPIGRALRDHVLASAIELWEGVPAVATRPTRCPYCGTLYVLAAEGTCPSCGASGQL